MMVVDFGAVEFSFTHHFDLNIIKQDENEQLSEFPKHFFLSSEKWCIRGGRKLLPATRHVHKLCDTLHSSPGEVWLSGALINDQDQRWQFLL